MESTFGKMKIGSKIKLKALEGVDGGNTMWECEVQTNLCWITTTGNTAPSMILLGSRQLDALKITCKKDSM
jgi:hypothetical protein